MEKVKGIHLYVNVKNLESIINSEELKHDDLKRTLHRLNTFYVGFSKLIKKYGGKVEKCSSGRAHVILESEEDEVEAENILELIIACFIYNNNLFNSLPKYKPYPKFSLQAGADFGNYFEYEIEDSVNLPEFTTIGRVANTSAKIQDYAPKNYIYITKKLYSKLGDYKDKFKALTDEEKEEFSDKIRGKSIYKAKYDEIFDDEKMGKIEEYLSDVKDRVVEESKSLNIGDIFFEGCTKKLSFADLSLKGKNKKLDNAGVICADIRGFTKLFFEEDQNLDDLKDVMKEIYIIMGDTVSDAEGTKVQYQGDRILAVFNDFTGAKDQVVRMLEAAFTLNQKIQELNDNIIIKEKLGNRKISIGIGCSSGEVIATRLGMNGNKYNIILSDSYKEANKCEDKYSDSNETVIHKKLMDIINERANELKTPEYLVLHDIFKAIGSTGYYLTSMTIDEFRSLVEEKKNLENEMNKMLTSNILTSHENRVTDIKLRPWGTIAEIESHNKLEDFDLGNDYSAYSTRVKEDFSRVKEFFPLLNLSILPTINPKEIFITGELIPYEALTKCASENDKNNYSLDIRAVYPSQFNDEEIYVIDINDVIEWNRVPEKHRHYRYLDTENGMQKILCTHHLQGEINGFAIDDRSIAILYSAWKLYIQYRSYIINGKWKLKDLAHGSDAIKQLKSMGQYYGN